MSELSDLDRANITIGTLTKYLRSAIDSAQDHQRNANRKEIELCEAKTIIRELIETGNTIEFVNARHRAKQFLFS